jgi:peptidoglycan/xylan/chitin deacetylase (PgdA/CDA1 family)
LSGLDITFDDGLACQELAFPLLEKHRKRAIFFLNNENKMVEHKAVRDSLGVMFYDEFWKKVHAEITIDPEIYGYKTPDDFLREYSFYTQADKDYRYFRDYVDPELHDEVMFSFKPVGHNLFIDPQKIVDHNHSLGLHSKSHPTRMDTMETLDQMVQWIDNLAMVKQYQERVNFASYPMGRFNETTKIILEMIGIHFAFTTSEKTTGNPLELPRIDIKEWLKK